MQNVSKKKLSLLQNFGHRPAESPIEFRDARSPRDAPQTLIGGRGSSFTGRESPTTGRESCSDATH